MIDVNMVNIMTIHINVFDDNVVMVNVAVVNVLRCFIECNLAYTERNLVRVEARCSKKLTP